MLSADKVNKAATWDWPELQFQKPYKTWWNTVQAKGPFTLNLHTEKLNAQELSFEMYWADPTITVGQFVLHDQIVKDMGGVQVIINVDGTCTGMNFKMPGANWKIRGRLAWGIVNQELAVQWREFEFVPGAAPAPVTQLGECVGPAEIQNALRENVAAVTRDTATMQDMMRKGMLAWLNNSLRGLKSELMTNRTTTLKPGLDLLWEPQFMAMLPGGIIRVPGYTSLRKQGVSAFPSVVDRTMPEQDFATVTESGYILPKNIVEQVAAFTYTTGDLAKRFKSTEIKGFVDLMNNRFNQSVVWPDLQKFATTTLFYFDLGADGVPQLSNIRQSTSTTSPGILYDAKAPVLIHDMAPARSQYLNYVDFRSTFNGQMRVGIKSQALTLQMSTQSLPLTAKFRSEYKSYRAVDETIDTTRLGTAGRDFINGKLYTFPLPQWTVGGSMKMVYGDLKLLKQSVMIPLSFQKK